MRSAYLRCLRLTVGVLLNKFVDCDLRNFKAKANCNICKLVLGAVVNHISCQKNNASIHGQ